MINAMRKPLLLLLASILLIASVTAQTTVTKLQVENLDNPVGVDRTQPAFSWQLTGNGRNLLQTAFELRVATDKAAISKGKNIIWSSGRINSAESLNNLYAGPQLQSAKRYYWQVRIWDNKGGTSGWSPVATWVTGLFKQDDWQAKWIGIGFQEDTIQRPGQLFRKSFTAAKKIQSATAFITAHGMYEAFINGQRVGDYYFTPGWTS
ncbi:MAG: alpha-L-rhamnosidase, partial [Sphingobacteriales bacterium]